MTHQGFCRIFVVATFVVASSLACAENTPDTISKAVSARKNAFRSEPIVFSYTCSMRHYLPESEVLEHVGDNRAKVYSPGQKDTMKTSSGTIVHRGERYVSVENGIPYEDSETSVTIVTDGSRVLVDTESTRVLELAIPAIPWPKQTLVLHETDYYDGRQTHKVYRQKDRPDADFRVSGATVDGKSVAATYLQPDTVFDLPKLKGNASVVQEDGNLVLRSDSDEEVVVDAANGNRIKTARYTNGSGNLVQTEFIGTQTVGEWKLPTELRYESKRQGRKRTRLHYKNIRYDLCGRLRAEQLLRFAFPSDTRFDTVDAQSLGQPGK